MENQQSTKPAQLLCSCLRTVEARLYTTAAGVPAAHPRPAPRLLAAADLPLAAGRPQPFAATGSPSPQATPLRPKAAQALHRQRGCARRRLAGDSPLGFGVERERQAEAAGAVLRETPSGRE